MKKLLILLLTISPFITNAQFGSCLDKNVLIYELDTNDFDGLYTAHFKLDIDTNKPMDDWRCGKSWISARTFRG